MQYQIKAYHPVQGVSTHYLMANDREEIQRIAESKGLRVIDIRSVKDTTSRWLSRRTRFNLMLFCQELLTLLQAGLNIVEAIDTLNRKHRDAKTSTVLHSLHKALSEGQPFSASLEAAPDSFPMLFVATVRSSESTGNLPEALSRYLAYVKQIHSVRDKIVSASIYPALLLGVGFLIIFFLLGYVVPRFSKIYEDIGERLPWMSRVLLEWGRFLDQNALWIGGVFTGLLILGVYTLKHLISKGVLQHLLWRVPALGESARTYELARFTRTLAMLLKGGVPFANGLGMLESLLHQPGLKQGLNQALRSIREGGRVSDVFLQNGLANEISVRMLAVGERSGELGEMMERIAQMHDDEIARVVDWFSRLFEPLLMIVIGVVIGVVILLMYLPIFELTNIVQ